MVFLFATFQSPFRSLYRVIAAAVDELLKD
jgi:hypothetical protein